MNKTHFFHKGFKIILQKKLEFPSDKKQINIEKSINNDLKKPNIIITEPPITQKKEDITEIKKPEMIKEVIPEIKKPEITKSQKKIGGSNKLRLIILFSSF